MAQDGPGHIQAELAANARPGAMAELVRMPVRNQGLSSRPAIPVRPRDSVGDRATRAVGVVALAGSLARRRLPPVLLGGLDLGLAYLSLRSPPLRLGLAGLE